MLLIKKACIKKFQNVVIESNHKPNKICVDKISEFYNRTLNSWLQYNEIEIYSKNNEESQWFLKHLLNCMTILKSMNIGLLYQKSI